jgi:hypothetical protein
MKEACSKCYALAEHLAADDVAVLFKVGRGGGYGGGNCQTLHTQGTRAFRNKTL